MDKPDEALLWAREEWESWARPTLPGGHLIMAHGYRAGAAASAERIKELEARVAELEAELPRRKDHRAAFAADAFYVGEIDELTDEDRYGWGEA